MDMFADKTSISMIKFSLSVYKDLYYIHHFISVVTFNINRPPSAFYCNHVNIKRIVHFLMEFITFESLL